VLAGFCDATALYDDPWKIIGLPYMSYSRSGSPGAGSHSIVVNLEPAALLPLKRPFAVVSVMSHRRRRVFVDTPKGRRSAGFTVPAGDDAAEVSMALRRRGGFEPPTGSLRAVRPPRKSRKNLAIIVAFDDVCSCLVAA
jgi:hypothetical protein